MATWPDNLPGPCRTISIQAGNNAVVRKLQSGRREVRRFGAGAPDRATVQFRLFNEDVAAFEYFFDRQTNLGANWFLAPWLPSLGYDDHRARILGYPKRKAKGNRFSDYSVTLLIAEAAYVPDDVFWLAVGTGDTGTSVDDWADGAALYVDAVTSAAAQGWADGDEVTLWENLTNPGVDMVSFGYRYTLGDSHFAYKENLEGTQPPGLNAGWSSAGTYQYPVRQKFKAARDDSLLTGATWSLCWCANYRAMYGSTAAYPLFTRHGTSPYEGAQSYANDNYFQIYAYHNGSSKGGLTVEDFPDDGVCNLFEMHCDGTAVELLCDGVVLDDDFPLFELVAASDSPLYFGMNPYVGAATSPHLPASLHHMYLMHTYCMTTEQRQAMRDTVALRYGVTFS